MECAGLTQTSVRRRLAEAEDQEVAAGAVLLHGEVSPFSLVAQGLDLEDQQYVLFYLSFPGLIKFQTTIGARRVQTRLKFHRLPAHCRASTFHRAPEQD